VEGPSGLVLVDKPAGPSSFAVLRGLRGALGRKLGHAGTLDPFATGLLLVLAGRATRLATWLSGLDKAYTATLQLGATSTTLDPEGELTETGGRADEGSLRAAAAGLRGEVVQRVPLASAVKVGGERSYARLRRGEAVEAEPRRVCIERLDVLAFDDAAQRARIAVRCSKGTYVRQIVADLGEATGAGAYCLELRREAVGPFSVGQAGTPAQVAAEPRGPWFLPPAQALPHLPLRRLDAGERERVRHGRAIAGAGEGLPTRLVFGEELVAVAAPGEDGLRPLAVLAP
jgi:tRNA pseudouridine55 synthase